MNTTCETKSTSFRQPFFSTHEDEAGARLRISLPGVKKEDIKLTVEQSALRVEAAREYTAPEDWKPVSPAPENLTYRLDVRLTGKLDGGNITASFENGVLQLDIPVREEAKPRQIYVN